MKVVWNIPPVLEIKNGLVFMWMTRLIPTFPADSMMMVPNAIGRWLGVAD